MNQSKTELMAAADRICERAHDGQFDKAGHRYVEHPRRVAAYVEGSNVRAQAAALLHDVLEDSSISAAELAEEGIPDEVITIVRLLTRSPEVSGEQYYRRIRDHADAREVKLADLADNTDPQRLALLEPSQRARLTAKYEDAYARLGSDPSDGDRRRERP